jgi:ATP/maltotriose-dependent transcriptional regulator MalT
VRALGYVLLASAQAWLADGDPAGAADLLAESRNALAPTLPPVHPTRVKFDLVEAQIAIAQGRLEAARSGLRKAWEGLAASEQHASMRIVTLRELARVEQQLGDAAAAAEHAGQAVALARRGLEAGEMSPATLAQAELAQAWVMQVQGRPEGARPLLEKAAAALAQSMGEGAKPTREARQLLAQR